VHAVIGTRCAQVGGEDQKMAALNSVLICPITGSRLVATPREAWEHGSGSRCVGIGPFDPIGLTDELAVSEDQQIAYPIVDGIPVLLGPEAFQPSAATETHEISVEEPIYAEAYQEMALYGSMATARIQQLEDSAELNSLRKVASDRERLNASFPHPTRLWFGAASTVGAQKRCFSFLAPIEEETVLQVGGTGSHALLLLLAGAERAVLVSPVLDELHLARDLASALGLADALRVVGGVAERLPLEEASFTRAFCGSSLHHTVTSTSFAELARVLKDGGRAASVDVWNAPLHGIGTRFFGKVGGNPYCRPLDTERIAPAFDFFSSVDVDYHGAVARYPIAILNRAGIRLRPSLAQRVADAEDRLAGRSEFLRRHASLVSLCCAK
jgi:uncharacterized protein YbaR (Trm112 family)/SAM-dependent methyltransferase